MNNNDKYVDEALNKLEEAIAILGKCNQFYPYYSHVEEFAIDIINAYNNMQCRKNKRELLSVFHDGK